MESRRKPPNERLAHVPGQLLVRVKPSAIPRSPGALKMSTASASALPESVSAPLDYLRRNAGLKSVDAIFSKRRNTLGRARVTAKARKELAVMSSVTDSSHEYLEGINMLAVDAKKVTPALLKKLTSSSSVEYVERMPARWTQAAKASKGVDPLLNLQWGLRAIRWFQAKRPKASRIEVAILDTGIDDRHPDFKGVSISYNYKPFRKRDLLGHGTHVAGTVAALANNSIGVAGVADCSLSIWKIFPDEPASDGEYYVDGEAYLRALRSVLDSRIKVVNLSIGGTEKSRTEAMLFRRMYDSGITVCAAMGNDFEYGNPKEYPAGYDGVLSIGSIAENRVRSSFSNTGRHIDLVGPGSNILSTLPRQKSPFYDGTKYGVMSGTSMATPHVAGAAALAVKKYPTLNALGIKKKLTKTQKLPMMRGKKWTPSYGAGLLDLSKAL